MGHPNEDLARRGYAAFATGDMGVLSELFSDDIRWHSPGRSPIAGDFKGKEEVLGSFGRIAELTGGNFTLDIHSILADDEHVVALLTTHAEREGGKTYDGIGTQVFHVRDGEVTESWFFDGDQYAADEFWS